MTQGPLPPLDQPDPAPKRGMNLGGAWRSLSRWGKVLVGSVAGLLVVLAIGGLAASGSSGETKTVTEVAEAPVAPAQSEAGDPTAVAEEPAEPEPTTEDAPVTPAAPPAPAAQRFSGQGSKVITVKFPTDGTPMIVQGRHTGSSNFIVGTPNGSGIFNEIGSFSGTVVDTYDEGRQRVNVDADGTWSLTFREAVARPKAPTLPVALTGKGQTVEQIRVESDTQVVVKLRHQGQSNFIVGLVPVDGSDFYSGSLANEIGTYSGETAVDVPAGNYLVSVVADGTWSVRFTP